MTDLCPLCLRDGGYMFPAMVSPVDPHLEKLRAIGAGFESDPERSLAWLNGNHDDGRLMERIRAGYQAGLKDGCKDALGYLNTAQMTWFRIFDMKRNENDRAT